MFLLHDVNLCGKYQVSNLKQRVSGIRRPLPERRACGTSSNHSSLSSQASVPSQCAKPVCQAILPSLFAKPVCQASCRTFSDVVFRAPWAACSFQYVLHAWYGTHLGFCFLPLACFSSYFMLAYGTHLVFLFGLFFASGLLQHRLHA